MVFPLMVSGTDMLYQYLHCAAIATVVTIAEILKNNGLAVEKSEIHTLSYIFLFLSPAFFALIKWK